MRVLGISAGQLSDSLTVREPFSDRASVDIRIEKDGENHVSEPIGNEITCAH